MRTRIDTKREERKGERNKRTVKGRSKKKRQRQD